MHDFGKVFTAAVVIIIWPWLFGQAIDLANTVTLAMLEAANANGNLWKTLAAYFVTAWAGGFLDLLTTAFLIATVVLLVGLIVMKIILMVALAFLLVVGPIAIAFYPFEFLSRILMLFGTVFLALAMVPLGWAVLFALFTAFGASVFGFSNFIHAGLIGGAMKDVFDLICSLICFYLALEVAVPDHRPAHQHHRRQHRRRRGGALLPRAWRRERGRSRRWPLRGRGGRRTPRAALAGSPARCRHRRLCPGPRRAAGGAMAGLTGTTPAQFAGYGLGRQGLNGMRAASSALRRNGGAGASRPRAASRRQRPGVDSPSPVGTAVADGPAAGFDAVRASGKNFSAGADALGTSGAALAGVGAGQEPRGGAGGAPPAAASMQTLARDAALSAALTSSPGAPVPPEPRPGTTGAWRWCLRRQRRAGRVSPGPRWPGRVLIHAQRLPAACLGPPCWPGCLARIPVTPLPALPAAGDSDPRQVLQASASPQLPPPRSARARSRTLRPLPRPVGTAELAERLYALGLAGDGGVARRRAPGRDRRLVLRPAQQRRPHSAASASASASGAVAAPRPCSSLPAPSSATAATPPRLWGRRPARVPPAHHRATGARNHRSTRQRPSRRPRTASSRAASRGARDFSVFLSQTPVCLVLEVTHLASEPTRPHLQPTHFHDPSHLQTTRRTVASAWPSVFPPVARDRRHRRPLLRAQGADGDDHPAVSVHRHRRDGRPVRRDGAV